MAIDFGKLINLKEYCEDNNFDYDAFVKIFKKQGADLLRVGGSLYISEEAIKVYLNKYLTKQASNKINKKEISKEYFDAFSILVEEIKKVKNSTGCTLKQAKENVINRFKT